MHSTPETRAAAQGVADYIEAHPEQHNQSAWVQVFDQEGNELDTEDYSLEDLNVCKTTMCVAGTAAFQRDGKQIFTDQWQRTHTWMDEGMKILGLRFDEANSLFYDTDNEEALDVVKGLAVGEWRGDDLTDY